MITVWMFSIAGYSELPRLPAPDRDYMEYCTETEREGAVLLSQFTQEEFNREHMAVPDEINVFNSM